MSILEDQGLSALKEGEVPQPQNQTREEVKGPDETGLGSHVDGLSPTYAEMKKKETYGQFWFIRSTSL